MSVQSYRTAQDRTETPRQTEYRLFALVTKSLIEAIDGEIGDLRRAVDWNRRVWLTLQLDLASDDNTLPDALKAQLISISIWVEKQSSRILRGEGGVDALIDVNRAIMDGLKSAGRPTPAASTGTGARHSISTAV